MLVRYLLTVLIVFYCKDFVSQNNYFPIVEKGKWGAIDSLGNVIIKPKYNYLSPFKNGICIYKRGDYYGLINSDEEIVVKGNFYDILDLNKKFKGEFLYQLIGNKQGIVNESGIEISPLKYNSLNLYNKFYVGKKNKDSIDVVSLMGSTFFTRKSDSIAYLGQNLFKSYEAGNKVLLTQKGRELVKDTSFILMSDNSGHRVFFKENKIMFFDTAFNKIIDTNVVYIRESNQMLYFKDSVNNNIAYSLLFKRFFKNSGELSVREYGRFRLLNDAGMYGVIDTNNIQILPFNYKSISYYDNNFYAITSSNKEALFDSDFQNIIPPLYDRVVKTKYGYRYSIGNKVGALDKTGKKITEARFGYINENSIPVKCYLPKEGIVQLIFDENWNFRTKKEFKKMIVLQSKSKTKKVSSEVSPLVRNQFGWFMDSLEVTKKDGTQIKVAKWGLKNTLDTVVTPPVFQEYVIENDSISYAYRGRRELKKSKKRIKDIPVGSSFNIVNHLTGEILVKQPVYCFYQRDFRNNNIARALTNKGIYLYDRSYSALRKDLHFAFQPQDGMLLYSVLNPNKKDKKNLKGKVDKLVAWQNYATGISLSGQAMKEYFMLLRSRERKAYRTPNIKFGFYNSLTNKDVFYPQFDIARSFKWGVSFVGIQNSINNKMEYGIIKKDTLVTPIIYSKVDYFHPITYDRLYIVTLDNRKQLYIDSLLNTKTLNLKNLNRVGENVIIASSNNKTGVLDDDLNWIVEPSFKRVLVAQNKQLIIKEKLHGVLSLGGDVLIAPSIKKKYIIPQEFGAKVYQNKAQTGKIGYYHYQYGELFSPFKGKIYESKSVILKMQYNEAVYYKKGQELKTNKLFSYTLLMENDSVLVTKKRKKIKIINKNTEEYVKVKNVLPQYLSEDGIYYVSEEAKGLLGFEGNIIIKAAMNSDLVKIGDSVLLAINLYKTSKSKRVGLVTTKGRLILPNNFNKVERVFNEVYFCFRPHGLSLFMSSKGDTLKTVKCRSYESTSNGLMLYKTREGAFFLDSTLSNVFQYSFYDAEPFVKGIATVKTREGWQVLNRSGELISIPSFQSMKAIANNTIVATEKPKHGIYNYHGNLIVPVEFEEINAVSSTVIQVIKGGKAGYISTKGKWLYNPF